MKIKIFKKDDEIVGKIIMASGNEIDFSNLKMIDTLYKCTEEVELEFYGLSDIEKSKIENLFDKIKQKINESKNSNSKETNLD